MAVKEKKPIATNPDEKQVKPAEKPQPSGWKNHPSKRPIVT